MTIIRKRSAFVAGLFSAISLGLGFLYVGKPVHAVALPLGLFLLLALGSWTKLIFSPFGALAVVVAAMVIALGSIVAAALVARRQQAIELKKFQRWYVYVGFVVATSIVADVLLGNRAQLFGYETFRFPSQSMDGTLLTGDFFISDTWKYKSHPPQRGELMVFRFPADPDVKYVKRVIGLPGDKVEMMNGTVIVNGTRLDEPYIKPENNLRTAKESLSFLVPEE